MIAIKGMEMPEECGECILSIWDDYEPAGFYCPLIGDSVWINGRDEDCPLIEVVE